MQCGCAAVCLLLLAPLFLVIGLMIKLTSRGPVLHRELHVGKDARIFTMYAFCTRYVTVGGKSDALPLIDPDAQCSRIGRLLERTQFDNLPQLLNVLKGDMNFVGPRPLRPGFLRTFGSENPRFPVRLTVKPGIVGLPVSDSSVA
jgi:lipopolysaccharide/colanic/teichoic acid biosynthesis glycosyltransferase